MIRDDYGMDTTQAVAGHADQRTTQGHYVGQKSTKGITIALPLQIGDGVEKDHAEVAGG
jgi:integrase